MTGQIICKCGRVAELRRRRNGKKLPYVQCKSCGLQQGKEELRTQWLANEDTTSSLGVFGEFPSTSSETSETVEPEQVTTSNEHQIDWVPDEDNPAENVEVEQAATPAPEETTSKSGLSLGAKVGLGILSLVAIALGVKNLNLPH